MTNNKQTLITEFDKNSLEKIKVHVNEYNGNRYIDVRVWFLPEAAEPGNEIATKKGIRLHCELIPDLIAALEQARDVIEGRTDND